MLPLDFHQKSYSPAISDDQKASKHGTVRPDRCTTKAQRLRTHQSDVAPSSHFTWKFRTVLLTESTESTELLIDLSLSILCPWKRRHKQATCRSAEWSPSASSYPGIRSLVAVGIPPMWNDLNWPPVNPSHGLLWDGLLLVLPSFTTLFWATWSETSWESGYNNSIYNFITNPTACFHRFVLRLKPYRKDVWTHFTCRSEKQVWRLLRTASLKGSGPAIFVSGSPPETRTKAHMFSCWRSSTSQ